MDKANGHLGVSDRLVEGPAPELICSALMLETEYGPVLNAGMNLADLAHTVMLVEAGVIPPYIGARLLKALLELHAIPTSQIVFDPALGDAYSNREVELRRRAADAADWLQAGRARREATTVAYLLVTRKELLNVTGALLSLLQALLDRASTNLDTLMPDYTYWQTAQPTTLAHYLLTFAQPIVRDLARLKLAYDHANRSPAGIGSTNGSRLPINRQRVAQFLGFCGLVQHTRDAMWQPDGPAEIMAALTTILLNAGRLAEDLQIWATAEFNYIELADRHSRISVIMPQKKNPYGLAYVRGVARDSIGDLVSAATLQATASGQIDNRIFLYGAVPRALVQATQALELLAGIVRDLKVNTTVMQARAQQDFSGATDLAETIMLTFGLSARTAHRIVSQAVRLATDAGRTIGAALLDEAAAAIINRPLHLSDRFIAESMDPQKIVDTRTVAGGAAPASVRAMIADLRVLLVEHQDWVSTQQRTLAAAERVLIETAEALCQPI